MPEQASKGDQIGYYKGYMHSMNEQEMAKGFEQLNSMVPERAHSSTVVLFAARSKEQQLIPYGTGSLFAIGDRHFVVTAAHVPTMAKQQEFSFLCATTKKGKFTPFLQGGWALMRKLDVAVFELTGCPAFLSPIS